MTDGRISIASLETVIKRTRDAARSIDRGDFTPQAPEFYFESLELMLSVITPARYRLLRALAKSGPTSIRALAREVGRDYRGVYSDVARLLEIGLIDRTERGRIETPYSKIVAEARLTEAA